LVGSYLETWKPVLANAINEWAKQRTLTTVLADPSASKLSASESQPTQSQIETTKDELDGFAIVQRLLGSDRPITYEDTIAYFKVHLPERNSWVICRFYFGRRRFSISVPLPIDRVQQLAPSFVVTMPEKGWVGIALKAVSDLERLGDVLVAAYEQQRALRLGAAPEPEPSVEETQPMLNPAQESETPMLRVAGGLL
jgi:predicted type IV restriction endonuclease